MTLANILHTRNLRCTFILPDSFDPLNQFVEGMVTIVGTLQPKSLTNVVAVYTFKNVDVGTTPAADR
jgi:hypothetical protein